MKGPPSCLVAGWRRSGGEEPELFYILGPVPTLAWVAQVSEGPALLLGGGLEEEGGEEPELFLHPGSCSHPSLGTAGE